MIEKFIPTYLSDSVFTINYELLKDKYNTILFDLDNTLIPYNKLIPSIDVLNLIRDLKQMGYDIIVISNNHPSRLSGIKVLTNDCRFFYHSFKPFKKVMLKKLNNIDLSKCIYIGDQFITDVLFCNRCNIDSILVNPIDLSTEKLHAKIYRIIEKIILKRIKKYNSIKYNEIITVIKR